jgi:hypothetical protein
MYERLLKQTERYLGNQKEILVPVKQVWNAMVKEGKVNNFAVPSLMADFECLLEGDRRFEFVNETKPSARLDPYSDDFLEHDEMEKLGFSGDQKMKLRRIPLPVSDDEAESVDALDAAISMEELGEEFTDSGFFDGGAASAKRGTPEAQPASQPRKSGASGSSGKPQKKSAKPSKKPSKRSASVKNRKK